MLRQFSNPNKFRLIHGLYQESRTAVELAEETGLSASTVRTNLSTLKSSGFVDYERQGKNHRYFLDFPLPTVVHEALLLIVLVTEPPPRKKAIKQSIKLDEEDRQLLIQDLKGEILWEHLKAFMKVLIPKHPGGRMKDLKEVEERIDLLRSDIEHLQESD